MIPSHCAVRKTPSALMLVYGMVWKIRCLLRRQLHSPLKVDYHKRLNNEDGRLFDPHLRVDGRQMGG